jgi:hypothetical protein
MESARDFVLTPKPKTNIEGDKTLGKRNKSKRNKESLEVIDDH